MSHVYDVILVSVANVILGLRLPHLDTEFAVYFVIAFCAGFGAVVALEIVLRCTRQKHRGKKHRDQSNNFSMKSCYALP